MECAGNGRATRFAMISVAEWAGVALLDLLNKSGLKRVAGRVMVSGFDHYSSLSKTSVEGADWILTLDELEAAKAFLATEMNGQPLTLEIRFNPEEDYMPVSEFRRTWNDPWTFWSHGWEPKAPGTYMIRLIVADPLVPTKRLAGGYYLRMVGITEI